MFNYHNREMMLTLWKIRRKQNETSQKQISRINKNFVTGYRKQRQ
jgi:hypothetical protein